MAAEIPAGRRKLERGEHLFLGRPHRGRHVWGVTEHQAAGTVVICTVCGKLQQGQTMPDTWQPITRG